MSKIHILVSDNDKSYKVAIHFPITSGNNVVGKSWKECALSSGMIGTTIFEVGSSPGNITQSEYDKIIAGNVVEIVKNINPGLNPSNDVVDEICDVLISMWQEDAARILKYYGHTIGV